jgi:hypothetical protein
MGRRLLNRIVVVSVVPLVMVAMALVVLVSR